MAEPQHAVASSPIASGAFECTSMGLTGTTATPSPTPTPTAPTDCTVQFVSQDPSAKLRGTLSFSTDMATANAFNVGQVYTLSIS